jgi:hypothetical protein
MISIDLQTGFNGEPIEIRIGDELVFRKEHVRTKKLIGVADTIILEKFDRREGVAIVVKVGDFPPYEISLNEASNGKHIGLSLADGKVSHLISEHPFGYG